MRNFDRMRSVLVAGALILAGWELASWGTRVLASGIQSLALVPAGGTSRTSLTAGAVLLGNGVSAVQFATTPSNASQALCGTNPPAFSSTCAGANYSQAFTAQTSVVLAHNLNTTAIIVQCFNNASPAVAIDWNTLTLTDANDATVTFTSSQSGTCVVAGAGGGGANNCSGTETVSFSATPVFNLSFCVHEMTLTGNVTSFTVTGGSAGATHSFLFIQDATGNRTVSSPPGSLKGFFTVGSTASTASAQAFAFDGTNLYAITPGVVNQ